MAKYLQKSPKADYHYIGESGVSLCNRASQERGYKVIELPAVPGHRICLQCYHKIRWGLRDEIYRAVIDAVTSYGAPRIDNYKTFAGWAAAVLTAEMFPGIGEWNDFDLAIVSQELHNFWRENR